MTRFILSILFLSSCFFSFAQNDFPQNQSGITGLPIIYPNNDDGNTVGLNGYAIYLSIGKFKSEKTAIGLRPFVGQVDVSFDRIFSIGLNGYYRRYFGNKNTRAFFDANAGFGGLFYSNISESVVRDPSDNNGVMFNFAFGPGVDISLQNGYFIEASIQYLRMRNISKPDGTTVGNTVIPSIGLFKYF